MAKKDITTLRGTLEFLEERGELLRVNGEVDPILEISGIEKALDNGPVLLYEKIKGYPGVRNVANLLGSEDVTAAIFGLDDLNQLRFRCLEAMKNPTPPVMVDNPPCQEVVITRGIDIMGTLPVIKHSADDAGRIIGGGIIPTMSPLVPKGTNLCFKRMRPMGPDWISMYVLRLSHLGRTCFVEHQGENVPLTINIGVSPAVVLVAGTVTIHTVVTYDSDEIGMAGTIQGEPVKLAKAKTVDAPGIADAEWVIEGYLTTEKVWESEEAEKLGKTRVAPFFPEWTGYLGRATRVNKFQVTAITHRKNPIYYTPLAHGMEQEIMAHPLREACFYETAQRIWPGLVTDVSIPYGFKHANGVVYKVNKKNMADEAAVKNILQEALAVSMVRLAVAVDEDIDISNADDIFWAIATRANFETGIMKGVQGALGMSMVPAADASKAKGGAFEVGGLAIDATAPLSAKDLAVRAHYPSDQIDLAKWFSKEQIAAVKARQSEYARLLARIGG